ncbi:MAG TPA: metalloregulator ArsR/SmtB family transcription factor [Gemmatimonadales bacterium]|nr:metalloregulator ArsR/SmtB family transcription factor [Gemmatimonadales bacterium]
MGKLELTPEVLELISERFKALGESTRLQLLTSMREGEKSVNELVEETGLGQANVSKHLQILHAIGFVSRRKQGLFVYYSLADESVFTLCDIMCGQLEERLESQRRILAS